MFLLILNTLTSIVYRNRQDGNDSRETNIFYE